MKISRAVAAGALLFIAVVPARGQTPAPASAPAGGGAVAGDYCPRPPPPPDGVQLPPAPIQPSLPGCVDPRTMMGRCKPAVLKRYNEDVNQYNAVGAARGQMGSHYAQALNAWTQEVSAYANCEITRMNASIASH